MRDEPVARIGQTAVGVVYAVSEGAPEQVRALIEGLQAPVRPGREVTWGEHPFEVLDAVDIEVVWDEATQRVSYRVPGAQRRSVPASALAKGLDRDWERYLKDCVLVGELLGCLDAVTPAGIDTEEEVTAWFDPQARTVVADIDLAPVPTPDGLSTPGLRGRITVGSHAFDLDLEGASPATQLSEADARMVLSDAVAQANQEPSQVAWEALRPYLAPFLDRGLETADPIVRPDGTVRVQVLTPAADAGDCLGIARLEQAVTFSLDHGGLVIRPGGSLTRQLRETGLDASDEDSPWWGLSPDLATDPDVREMTDAEAAATILGMRLDAFDAAAQGVELGLTSAEKELAKRNHRRKA